MKACITCGKSAKLSICAPCAERAEDTLHPLPAWTRFERADVVHDDLREEGFESCWKNSRYTVWVRRPKSDQGELVHLSIKRNDKNPLHDWRDLQRIKNEILGPEEEALELYPRESRLVDGANQYHLWAFIGQTAPFGYEHRCVMGPTDAVVQGAKQRDFEEPPKDLMTEEEFQRKAAEYRDGMARRAASVKAIRAILDDAAVQPCARGGQTCEATDEKNPAALCGPCMARVIERLEKTAGMNVESGR